MEQLLKDKVAVVYGAGSIGGAVASAFAREGAKVCFAAQHPEKQMKVADRISKQGGYAETSLVDVLNKESVDKFVNEVITKHGKIDISFCATNVEGGEQGSAISEITYEEFSTPIVHYTKSQFITANAASRHMIKQGFGVILMITAIPSRIPIPFTTGFGPAWAAIEAMSRTLAAELGPHGIRTVCLHSAGSPEAQESIDKSFRKSALTDKRMKEWKFIHRSLLNQWPTLAQVGDMAAFMASDYAAVTTGASINLTGGIADT